MNTNNRLVLNGEFSRKDHGMLHYAKNIQLSEDYKVAENEDGFLEIIHLVNSNATDPVVLGHIIIKDSIIIFCNVTENSNRYFCIVEFDCITNERSIILKDTTLKVSDNNCISAEFSYNSKHERILFWCDGIATDSNPPYTLNIDNNYEIIDIYSRSIKSDKNNLRMFMDASPLNYSVSVLSGGNLKGGAYYITTRIYYNDDVVAPWDVVRGPWYVGKESGKHYNKSIAINVYNIPERAVAIEYAVIVVSEGITTARIINKQSIVVAAGSGVTLAISNDEGTAVDIKELLVKLTQFNKVDKLALVNNKLYACGVEERDSFINYQKYANDIFVTWELQNAGEITDEDNCFQDGEVYAFYISLMLTNGAQTPPFHIPGREAYNASEKLYSNDPTNSNYYSHNHTFADKGKLFSHDVLTVDDFKTSDELLGVNIIIIKLRITETGYPVYIRYNKYGFLTLSPSANKNTSQYLTCDLINNKIYLKSGFTDPLVYTVQIFEANSITESLFDTRTITGNEEGLTDITNRFDLKDREFCLTGGRNIIIDTASSTQGYMSYHENKNEFYRNDDIVVYPTGNVRHHRFPVLAEMGYVTNTDIAYERIKLKPKFHNIIIPKELKSLVKGIVISFARKDINDKTVYLSPVHPMHIDKNFRCQGLTGDIHDFAVDDGGNAYLKLLNQDLLYAQISNQITHIIPSFKLADTCQSNYVYDNTNNSLGMRFGGILVNGISTRSQKCITKFHYQTGYSSVTNPTTQVVTNTTTFDNYNAYSVIHHEYVPDNKLATSKKESGVSFYNTGSEAFTLIKIPKLNHEPTRSPRRTASSNILRSLVDGRLDASVANEPELPTYNYYNGCRVPEDVIDKDSLPPQGVIKPYGFRIVELPYVYAYVSKSNIHLGFENNIDRVVAFALPVDQSMVYTNGIANDGKGNLLVTVNNAKGDTKKYEATLLQTMFPFPLLDDLKQSMKAYSETINSKDLFYKHLDKFNAGGNSKLSWSIHTLVLSGVVDIRRYYTKDDLNKLTYEDTDRIGKASPIADRSPYYDKDYHNLNVFGAPIADLEYKDKITDSFNVIAWSDTSNDVKTNVANLQMFRSSNRYHMPIENGKIINVIKRPYAMYIQQERALSLGFVKDTLDSNSTSIYTGSGDIFDRPPKTIFNSAGENIFCYHSRHCQDSSFGVIVIDNYNKAVYMINQETATPISHIDCDKFFRDELRADYKNPMIGQGWHIGVDTLKNTLYMTSLDPANLWTLSFNGVIKGWHSFHDYNGMYMIDTRNAFYSINKGFIYKHGKGSPGLYYRNADGNRVKYPTILDIVCSDQRDVHKVYETIIFETKYLDVLVKQEQYDKSVNGLMVYNESQCSGLIDITRYHGDDQWYLINKRNIGAVWIANEFRDQVIDNKLPFIDSKTRSVIPANLDTDKNWYDKSLLISNACVIRFVIDNDTDNKVQLVNLNVYARKSNV